MNVYYLDHSGFAVETKQHLLVFDYYTDSPKGGALTDGVVTVEKLPENKQLCAFASHFHHDHYNKVIHRWKEQRNDTLLFLGDDIFAKPDTITVSAGQTVEVDGLSVSGLRSTDSGVAFVVVVDGLTIYHAGDLNWWRWEGESPEWLAETEKAYKTEIDRLSGRRIDLAFVPVDPRLEGSSLLAAQYFMTVTNTAHMLPMHMWGDYSVCERLINDPASKPFADKIHPIDHRGQVIALPGVGE